jgi:hypothetical protein
VSDVTGLVDPRHFELADIGLVYLLERAVAPAVAGSVILGPVVRILGAGASQLRRRGLRKVGLPEE